MAAVTLSTPAMHAWTWQGWIGGGCDHRGEVSLTGEDQLQMFVDGNRVRFDVLRMMQTASGAVIDYPRDGDPRVIRRPAEIKPDQYWRCDSCGHVIGPQGERPGGEPGDPYAWVHGCPQCHANNRRPSGYSPTEVVHPPRPSDEAVARDTRDCEAAIRATYRRLRPNFAGRYDVPLTALREALGDRWPREVVDAALTKLGAHDDVFLHSRSHKQTDPATQAAALQYGGDYSHGIVIDRARGAGISRTLQVIGSADYRTAQSSLAPLSDRDVNYLAERLGVDTAGGRDAVAERVAQKAEANRRAWLTSAEQEREDGTLLYRADHEPEWVATWTDADRQAAREAAQRMLQWGGGNSADHHGYYERARRWL